MKNFIKKIGTIILAAGLNIPKLIYSIIGLFAFIKDAFIYLCSLIYMRDSIHFKFSLYPILGDRYGTAGIASGHYFHQDLWASRKIHELAPLIHVDVGSRIDGFISHLLTFRDVIVIDVRKLESKVKGLTFLQHDMMSELPVHLLGFDSVSSLHAIEHFGLGRYGDPVDPNGWSKGFINLSKMLKNGGYLYFSVPVGEQRVEFNAHRIFSPNTIIDLALTVGLSLIEFSLIDDEGNFHENITPDSAESCHYACGCFLFIKIG